MSAYSLRDAVRVPGLLSLARVPLAIAFALVLDRDGWPWLVLGASALSDVLDGWYARRTGQATKTGALLDGVVDKLFVGTVVIALVISGRLGPAAALALGVRDVGELMIAAWLAVVGREHLTGAHRVQWPGKVTTALQYLTVGAAIVRSAYTDAFAATTAVAGAVTVVAYWRAERAAVSQLRRRSA